TPALAIKVLSNRADLVSGGDALVEIVLPKGVTASGLTVSLGTQDVSSTFAPRAALAGRVVGLVSGLKLGANTLTARSPSAQGARLTMTDYPTGGPIFAGPQVQPWICNTTGLGLGPATDAQCDTAPVYTYQYKS